MEFNLYGKVCEKCIVFILGDFDYSFIYFLCVYVQLMLVLVRFKQFIF